MLDFSNGGYENLFRKALSEGINLFCGAGFSVEAFNTSGDKLMLGIDLLNKMKEIFPSVKSYTQLSRASTKLINTHKEEFYKCLTTWFSVGSFSPAYLSLLKIKLKNIYTTNIDDLFFKILDSSDTSYLVDRSVRGALYNDDTAVNYFPLHGCVRHENSKYIFGTTEIAAAFSRRDNQQSWKSLAEDAAKHSILFWGWNFDDSGPLQAIYQDEVRTRENTQRWILIRKPSEEILDFLQSLKFNIIIGDTASMLKYISEFTDTAEKTERDSQKQNAVFCSLLSKYDIPSDSSSLTSYPLQKFFY